MRIKLFEQFLSKEQRKQYYRDLAASRPKEERIINFDDLINFDIPDEIKEEMKNWEVIYKSPLSDSFYSSTDIGFSHKPDGSFRVSDHWNFKTKHSDKIHCKTYDSVKNTSHISLAVWNEEDKMYKIILSLPSKKTLSRTKNIKDVKEFWKDKENIKRQKEFKERIKNKEIIAEIEINGRTIKGIVSKYTGSELKLEDDKGNRIFGENYLKRGREKVRLFDTNGNRIFNPFM